MRRNTLLLVLLVLATVALMPLPAIAQSQSPTLRVYLPIIVKASPQPVLGDASWPTVFHDLQRTNNNTGEARMSRDAIRAAGGLRLAWAYSLEYQSLLDSPAVVLGSDATSGVVYTRNLQFVDLQTGSPLPAQPFAQHKLWPVSSTLAADGARLYYVESARTKAIDRVTGQLLWTFDLPGGGYSTPTVYQNTVYVLSYGKHVYALDAQTGSLKWTFATGAAFNHATVALANGVLYARNISDALYALNAGTGQLLWSHKLEATGDATPAVCGDKVILEDTRTVKALDALTGALKWQFDPEHDLQAGFSVLFANGAPACAGNKVIVSPERTTLHHSHVFALNLESGAMIWKREMPESIFSAPAIVQDAVFIGCDDKKVYALDADTGEIIWSYQTGNYVRAYPVIAGGKLLMTSYDRSLYAFDLPAAP